MARFQRVSIRQKSWAGWDCWTTFSQNWKHEASTASTKSSVRRSELRDPAAGACGRLARHLPDFHVFPQDAGTRLAAEDVPILVDGAEFRTASRCGARIATLIQNEVFHAPVQGVPNPHALCKAWIVDIVRL